MKNVLLTLFFIHTLSTVFAQYKKYVNLTESDSSLKSFFIPPVVSVVDERKSNDLFSLVIEEKAVFFPMEKKRGLIFLKKI